ncbi:hypothetical protein LTR66_004153 [Elasticomyces elasticus]|nr:hypothetical protein LTR66_004153 [Elasticomyces elasticus]
MFDKELWSTFTYKERYPGWQEIRRYFQHVEKVWDLNKDISFHKHVDTATYDEDRHQWLVECSDGSLTYCRWVIPGASGIQFIQAIGAQTKQMTIYQRTPNQCLPMNQKMLDEQEEEKKKAAGEYEKAFANTWKTFSGFTYDFQSKNTFDDTPEEREKFYDQLLNVKGGFNFWLGNYKDSLYSQEANEEAYKFWRKNVLKRIPDPKKAALLAPEYPVHPWGTRRSSLEQNFYEVISMPHIDIIDINENPIEEVTATGIRTKLGHVEADVLILATGFDAVTGSLTQLDVRGTHGETIAHHWKNGVKTSMGIAIPGFPNMFIMYGPQAPTGFANGPSCAQQQAAWIDSTIETFNKEGITRVEAKEEPALEWGKRCQTEWDKSLFPLAKSWWQGSNIPGKKVEALNWAGGLVPYRETLAKSLENGFQDWIVSQRKVNGTAHNEPSQEKQETVQSVAVEA